MRALSELLGKILLAALVLWAGSVALTPAALRPQVLCRPLTLAAEAAVNLLAAVGYPGTASSDSSANTASIARACTEFATAAGRGTGVAR